ncbi:DinB family protein [Mucilaginibacter sabulilitoris]|uniref:DinB family protein n=1 Tax=Mucilaginibacter sabulilitoris TaxID=1173583 RepID=A0ABZ0TR82_9SPHI|nr:DinB family protein [Mucilaginibacter sabulilitoris]WPU94673.1 DinB family protein [Mucilaginibacter sabulilitoris]
MKTNQSLQVINQVLGFWQTNNNHISALFDKHADETYLERVAPGRNTGMYILGHLIAVSDDIFYTLGLGNTMFPELAKYLGESEANIDHEYSIADLKNKWEAVNKKLMMDFSSQTTDWWLGRHMRVSEADFAADPSRNKLSVLLSRASHESYHGGQLIFLAGRHSA